MDALIVTSNFHSGKGADTISLSYHGIQRPGCRGANTCGNYNTRDIRCENYYFYSKTLLTRTTQPAKNNSDCQGERKRQVSAGHVSYNDQRNSLCVWWCCNKRTISVLQGVDYISSKCELRKTAIIGFIRAAEQWKESELSGTYTLDQVCELVLSMCLPTRKDGISNARTIFIMLYLEKRTIGKSQAVKVVSRASRKKSVQTYLIKSEFCITFSDGHSPAQTVWISFIIWCQGLRKTTRRELSLYLEKWC